MPGPPASLPCPLAPVSCPRPSSPPCSSTWRSLDGACNNLETPSQGSSGEPYLRLLPAQYGPEGEPRAGSAGGGSLPSARAVAAALLAGELGGERQQGLSVHAMQWGQFLSHDLAATPTRGSLACCREDRDRRDCAPVDVARDDPVYGPRGVTCLPLVRWAAGWL